MPKPVVKFIIHEYSYHESPQWLSERNKDKNFVILAKDAPIDDVDLFLFKLFRDNDIDIEQSSIQVFQDLLKVEELLVGGGVLFMETTEKNISSGCCVDLGEALRVLPEIREKEKPWLGHDPSPAVEYIGNTVRIWSDSDLATSQPLENAYPIDYGYEDLVNQLKQAECELREFIDIPLFNRIHSFDRGVAEKIRVILHACIDSKGWIE